MVILGLPFGLGFDVVGIVEDNTTLFQGADMVFIRMLVKGHQHIGVITGAEHFARADAHLKDRGPPEIVEGMVMNVMTSCSLRPARRARKPPMA